MFIFCFKNRYWACNAILLKLSLPYYSLFLAFSWPLITALSVFTIQYIQLYLVQIMSEVCIESIAGLDKRQRSQVKEDVVCTLSLQAKMLMDWRYNLNQGKANSYVSQLNENVKGKFVQIATDKSDRLESQLSKKAGEISTQLRKRKRNCETIMCTEDTSLFHSYDEVLNVKGIEEKYR